MPKQTHEIPFVIVAPEVRDIYFDPKDFDIWLADVSDIRVLTPLTDKEKEMFFDVIIKPQIP